MTAKKNDILQGTLALLILRTLDAQGRMPGHATTAAPPRARDARGRVDGYAITAHIQVVSNQLLRVEEGSLYPALHRMEQDGWVRAAWGKTEKNREARFYSTAPKGRRQLETEQRSWRRLTEGVARVLAEAQ